MAGFVRQAGMETIHTGLFRTFLGNPGRGRQNFLKKTAYGMENVGIWAFFARWTPCHRKKTMLYSRSNMILLDLFRGTADG